MGDWGMGECDEKWSMLLLSESEGDENPFMIEFGKVSKGWRSDPAGRRMVSKVFQDKRQSNDDGKQSKEQQFF